MTAMNKTSKINIMKLRSLFVLIGLFVSTSIFAQQNNELVQKAFDQNGNIISETHSYVNQLGRVVQVQDLYIGSNSRIVNQNLLDRYGRESFRALNATVSGTSFSYIPNFIQNQSGAAYTYLDFDNPLYDNTTTLGGRNNPKPLGTNLGTLGHFYGVSSSENGFAKTSFPYSTVLFKNDGTAEIDKTAQPGEFLKMGSQKEITTSLLKIDQELQEYLDLRHLIIGMDEVVAESAPSSLFIGNISFPVDVSSYVNQSFELLAGSTATLDPGFDTNGGDFEISFVNASEYISMKDQGTKNITIDANGVETHTYSDLSGNVLAVARKEGSNLVNWSYNIYDDNAKLVAEISPNGVSQWRQGVDYSNIDKTTYQYNARGFLQESTQTEKGTTQFIYTNDGTIRFSQNELQRSATPERYSYTNYDEIGRPVESGEFTLSSGGLNFLTDLNSIVEDLDNAGGSGAKSNQIHTFYDVPHASFSSETGLGATYKQRFLRGALSHTYNDFGKSWYSYDDEGNVLWMAEKPTGLGKVFLTENTYDFNGNVTNISFRVYDENASTPEKTFDYRLTYNVDQRLSKVETSYNGGNWIEHAEYHYFFDGKLKRLELADNLQGVDFRYTPQGWLKSINHPQRSNDPGGDALGTNGIHEDVFGMTLEYFEGDRLDANLNSQSINVGAAYKEQFGGIVRAMVWKSPLTMYDQSALPSTYAFQYDDDYQLLDAQFGTSNFTTKTFTTSGNTFKVSDLQYDLNGNVQKLKRYGKSDVIHDLTYNYISNTNKLLNTGSYSSYQYDNIGKVIEEVKGSNVQKLEYDVRQRVTRVKDANGNVKVEFTYNAQGLRQQKKVVRNGEDFITWYVYGPDGSLMAVYDNANTDGTYATSTTLKEIPVYGSGKLGVFYPEKDETLYELTDHLGNVRATVASTKNEDYDAYFANASWDAQTGDEIKIFEQNNATITNGQAVLNGGANSTLGVSKMLLVMPGDQVSINVDGGMSVGSGTQTPQSGLLSSVFSAFVGGSMAGELQNQITNAPNNTVLSLFANTSSNTAKAYINYIFLDLNFNFITGGFSAISTGSISPATTLSTGVLDQPGYIFIYTSNESTVQATAFYDNLKIDHAQGIARSTADYYPFGGKITENSFSNISPKDYRFGYQGQFAEWDLETGWNSFEARMYDPFVGRYMIVDPASQFFSPYLGMGNNPINVYDPDGEFGLIGALIGGISSGISAYRNGARGWELAAHVGVGAALGSVTGGIGSGLVKQFGVKALGYLGAAIGGAAGGAASQALEMRFGRRDNIDYVDIAFDGTIGIIDKQLGGFGKDFLTNRVKELSRESFRRARKILKSRAHKLQLRQSLIKQHKGITKRGLQSLTGEIIRLEVRQLELTRRLREFSVNFIIELGFDRGLDGPKNWVKRLLKKRFD